MNNAEGSRLKGVATRGQLRGYRVEVWPADPEGWDVLYFPPAGGAVEYNSWAEDWAMVLEYGDLYGVTWEDD